eukprot:PhF_6_TR21170/c1_g1_i4/m.30502
MKLNAIVQRFSSLRHTTPEDYLICAISLIRLRHGRSVLQNVIPHFPNHNNNNNAVTHSLQVLFEKPLWVKSQHDTIRTTQLICEFILPPLYDVWKAQSAQELNVRQLVDMARVLASPPRIARQDKTYQQWVRHVLTLLFGQQHAEQQLRNEVVLEGDIDAIFRLLASVPRLDEIQKIGGWAALESIVTTLASKIVSVLHLTVTFEVLMRICKDHTTAISWLNNVTQTCGVHALSLRQCAYLVSQLTSKESLALAKSQQQQGVHQRRSLYERLLRQASSEYALKNNNNNNKLRYIVMIFQSFLNWQKYGKLSNDTLRELFVGFFRVLQHNNNHNLQNVTMAQACVILRVVTVIYTTYPKLYDEINTISIINRCIEVVLAEVVLDSVTLFDISLSVKLLCEEPIYNMLLPEQFRVLVFAADKYFLKNDNEECNVDNMASVLIGLWSAQNVINRQQQQQLVMHRTLHIACGKLTTLCEKLVSSLTVSAASLSTSSLVRLLKAAGDSITATDARKTEFMCGLIDLVPVVNPTSYGALCTLAHMMTRSHLQADVVVIQD